LSLGAGFLPVLAQGICEEIPSEAERHHTCTGGRNARPLQASPAVAGIMFDCAVRLDDGRRLLLGRPWLL
jgi:hypothetical protein